LFVNTDSAAAFRTPFTPLPLLLNTSAWQSFSGVGARVDDNFILKPANCTLHSGAAGGLYRFVGDNDDCDLEWVYMIDFAFISFAACPLGYACILFAALHF
jgi:hypothetical protein